MARLATALIFALALGPVFIYLGVRRTIGARREANPGEARFWGAVGVPIGLAILGGLAWFYYAAMQPADAPGEPPAYRDLEP